MVTVVNNSMRETPKSMELCNVEFKLNDHTLEFSNSFTNSLQYKNANIVLAIPLKIISPNKACNLEITSIGPNREENCMYEEIQSW